jgi:quercetin dioxygenase-like cupin family protein
MSELERQTPPYLRQLGGVSSYWSLGLLQTFLVEGRDTGGRVTLGEGLARKGTEPPPHTHTREDEAYYILEGELTFHVGGQIIEAKPGDFVWLPRGVEHSFDLHTPQARALIMFTPAGLEEAFKQIGEPARSATLPPPTDEPLDVQEVLTLFGAYGLQFGPPTVSPGK